jgi:hypothetical protein
VYVRLQSEMMKKIIVIALVMSSLGVQAQSVFGYWYGNANVKSKSSANNYLVELVVQPEKGYVKAVLNYYFKSTFRSLSVKGNYNAAKRQLSLYDIPLPYHGSIGSMEVDCIMNMTGTLLVSKVGSKLVGSFVSLPKYKYTCTDLKFELKLNADISKQDSVLKAIREFKESYQVWTPTASDTLVAANIIPRKITNYVVEDEYKQRENVVANEIEVDADTVKVDFYDNGEVDGDSISVFFNSKLIATNQKLSTRSIHFDLPLDSAIDINDLTMFADNLGSIPPNTALMQVYDGKNRHEIRLSSSLEKNATVRIKRKKKKP